MKKVFTLVAVLALGYAVNAQKATVEAKKVAQAAQTVEVDPHKGHNHGTEGHVAAPVTTVTPATVATPAIPETIVFSHSEHDFGKIPQGKPVTYVFEFKNSGSTSMKLDNVQAACGCTTPEWNKDEIAPGATSKITVGYNAAAEGSFTKPITVTYNGGASKILNIKGEVWKTPTTSAPENGTLNNLKN